MKQAKFKIGDKVRSVKRSGQVLEVLQVFLADVPGHLDKDTWGYILKAGGHNDLVHEEYLVQGSSRACG